MGDPPAESKQTIYKHMLAGSIWALAMRWGIRGIGLISVVILARLLTPMDFGIVAMGSLLIGLIDGFAELGTGALLLRQREITRADCDTAWTIRLIQGAVISVVLLVSAPLAVRYFSEPRLLPVIFVLALCSLMAATSNIGATLVRKELDFAKDFRYGVYQKLGSFLPTLAFAMLLRDYWALVFGNLVGTVVAVALSYRIHPYRPRLSLEKARQYLAFSIAVVGSNVAGFLKAKVDVLVIGGNTDAALMGSYNVASELAAMATQEIVVPVWRGLFPTFAKIVHEHDRFITAYGHYLHTIAILCLPLGLGLCVVADDCVMVLLGSKWTAAVAPLKWLAVCATIVAMIDAFSGSILFVSGHEHRATLLMWVHLAVLIPMVWVAGMQGGVEPVAMAATLAAAILLPISAIVLMRSIKYPFSMMWRSLWSPLLAVAVMVVAIKAFPALPELPAVMRLGIHVLIGGLTYVSCLVTFWIWAGRPEGPERAVWGAVRSGLVRVRGR